MWCIGRVRRIWTETGFSTAVVALVAMTALAKGGVEQITVSGPGLVDPIEINDPEILEQFNPWGGLWRILDVPVEKKAVESQNLEGPYEVRFWQGPTNGATHSPISGLRGRGAGTSCSPSLPRHKASSILQVGIGPAILGAK